MLAVFACTVSVALVTAAPLDSYHGDSVVKSSDVCLWLCNQCFGTEVSTMLRKTMGFHYSVFILRSVQISNVKFCKTLATTRYFPFGFLTFPEFVKGITWYMVKHV